MKILFVYNSLRSFVRKDMDILASVHEVRELNFRRRPASIREAWEGVRWADMVFSWFASLHSWVPALMARHLGKPSMVVAAGYDVVNMPEINYGSMRGGIRKWISRSTLLMAERVLAASDFNRQEMIANAGLPPEKVETIYLGFETIPERLPDSKEKLVLTVGNIEPDNLIRKGHEMFVRVAASFPNISFVLAGSQEKKALRFLQDVASPNISFPGFVSDQELQSLFSRAQVYLQPSAHEAFGCSVAEAMLYGCCPVVSDRGALPEVVNGTGVIFPFGDRDAAIEAVAAALEANTPCLPARERIQAMFPLSRRRNLLLCCVEQSYAAARS